MALNFTLRQLEYFQAIASHSSISAAAEHHNISRSALSSAVSDLETTLGVQLFIRKRASGVVLTPIGIQLRDISREVLESAGRIELALRGGELSGHLGVGCITALGPTVAPPLLDYFRENHPQVTMRLRTGEAEEILKLLNAGDIELAIGYGLGLHASVQSETLFEDRIHAIFPENHRLAKNEVVNASDLRDEPMVLLDTAQSADSIGLYFASLGFRPNVHYRFSNFEVVRSLVARGVGYSLVIQHPVSNLSYEGLGIVARPLNPQPPAVPVSVVWMEGRRLTSLAEEARNALRTVTRPSAHGSLYSD